MMHSLQRLPSPSKGDVSTRSIGSRQSSRRKRPVQTVSLPTTLFVQWPHLVFVCPVILYATILLLYPINCAFSEPDKQPHCCKEPLVSYLIEPDYSYGIFNLAMGQFLVFEGLLWSELFRIRMQEDKFAIEKNARLRYRISQVLMYVRYVELFCLGIWSVTRMQTSNLVHRNGAVAFGLLNFLCDFTDSIFWPTVRKKYWMGTGAMVAFTLFLMNPMKILPNFTMAFVFFEHVAFVLSTCFCFTVYGEFARAQQGYRSLR